MSPVEINNFKSYLGRITFRINFKLMNMEKKLVSYDGVIT